MSTGPVSVLLAGPGTQSILSQMYPVVGADPGRFTLATMSDSWQRMLEDVKSYTPDVCVIMGEMAGEPNTLAQGLATLPASTLAIVVLPAVWMPFKGMIESCSQSVRGVFIAPVNWAQVFAAAHSAVITARQLLLNTAPMTAGFQQAPQIGVRQTVIMGTKVLVPIAFEGGVGRSSLVEAMAVQLARSGVKTLLASFNSPPAAVLRFGLNFNLTAATWFQRPTPEGFQAMVQHPKGLENLDIILAPNTDRELNDCARNGPENPVSIRSMLMAAHAFNYGVILVDPPPYADSQWTIQSVLAANSTMIVVRLTAQSQASVIRSMQLFTERLKAQLQMPRENMSIVVNHRSSADNMNERQFQEGVAEYLPDHFCPPLMGVLPHEPALPGLQNEQRNPMIDSGAEAYAKAVKGVLSKVVGSVDAATGGNRDKSGGLKLPGLKIKFLNR